MTEVLLSWLRENFAGHPLPWGFRIILVLALVVGLIPFPASSALALDGVWHDPTGIDELYSTEATSGQAVYAVGSVPQLGMWSPASAVKLDPTSYPTLTGTITNLPPNTAIEWKCIKRQEDNYPDTADAWQPGANNSFTTSGSGSAGTTSGGF